MVKRGLVDSAYNERRSQCEQGVDILKEYLPEIKALRDVTPEDLAKYQDKLPPVVAKRCEHIVFENERVKDSVAALRAGNVERFGQLMRASHESLRDLYEVSCRELDIMVEAAWQAPGVCGARMTGAGFGGCTVNLVGLMRWIDLLISSRPSTPRRRGLTLRFTFARQKMGQGPWNCDVGRSIRARHGEHR